MSEWRKGCLGDVCELKRGYDLPASRRETGTVPIVSSSGITGFHSEAKVRGPGVVTGRYGTLGEVFYLDRDFWPLNTALYVRDFKGNEPRFVAAVLQSLGLGRNQIAAAVPGVNRNQLHTLPVRWPDLDTQRAIAAVLSCIDDLISNNRRRIRLLEQMAGKIYDEWFVQFRFPGYKDRNLVKSVELVPNGWKMCEMGDVLELKYGKALKADDRRGGSVAVVGSSGIVGWHDESLVSGPAVVVGRKGNVGAVTWITGSAWPIDTTYYVASELPLPFLYEQLTRTAFVNSHAAVPGLSREDAYSRPFLVPGRDVIDRYADLWETLNHERYDLEKAAATTTQIRQLLLPKLLSGQIEVSALSSDAAVEVTA